MSLARSFSQRVMDSPLLWTAIRRAGDFAQACGLDTRPPPLKITRYTIASPAWPDGHKPFRVAMAADFHAGCTSITLEELNKVAGEMNALKADIIFMPGDFVNSAHGSDGVYIEPAAIADVLGSLSAPQGVFAVLGNHDIYEDPQGMVRQFRKKFIRVLFNEAVVAGENGMRFNLVGVGDCTTGNARSKEAFRDIDPALPVIAMCHNPYSIHEMPRGIVAAVAGHTHGTQFRIPGIRQPIQGCPDSGLDYGMIRRDGKPIIVTGGIGTSTIPFRNHPPEIVEISIVHGPA